MESVFFFFKHRPAYEMRIIYWSSDLCSSDVNAILLAASTVVSCPISVPPGLSFSKSLTQRANPGNRHNTHRPSLTGSSQADLAVRPTRIWQDEHWNGAYPDSIDNITLSHITQSRSEEHTSEHQPLMRITYAVFCLKKNKSNHK